MGAPESVILDTAWATALAIAGRSEEWGLVAGKAREWLCSAGHDPKQLVQEASDKLMVVKAEAQPMADVAACTGAPKVASTRGSQPKKGAGMINYEEFVKM